jgi:hypothetical protein
LGDAVAGVGTEKTNVGETVGVREADGAEVEAGVGEAVVETAGKGLVAGAEEAVDAEVAEEEDATGVEVVLYVEEAAVEEDVDVEVAAVEMTPGSRVPEAMGGVGRRRGKEEARRGGTEGARRRMAGAEGASRREPASPLVGLH